MAVKEIDIEISKEVKDINLINPFPGLRPFGFEESHLFFGREGQSDDILVKLSQNRFAAVIGASGSGKSSLMYCGLIPVLYGGFMADAGSEWVVITARPGNSPIENLAESIVKLNPEYDLMDGSERDLETTLTNVILKSSSMGLVDALKPFSGSKENPTNFLVMIDQFEELFRFLKRESDNETANISAAFVNMLIKSINQSELPIYVAITMRSDFIGDCAQFPDLTQIINKSHYLIPQMIREQQKMAIEGPIAVGGGKVTRRLTQQLLNDVGNNPDQLPILQHALMRTWDYWMHNREEGEPIDLRHYIAIGKLEEALSQHANESFSELDKSEREICEVIFRTLTEKGRENYGIRRAAKIEELSAIAGVNEEEIVGIVEKFRRPGRSLLMPPASVPLRSNTVIEISHESLMRIWDRLKNWVDDEFESAQMYRRLSDAAAMYQVGRTGLWRPPDLQLALNWQKKQQPTRAWAQRYNPVFERAMLFLDTSKTAYENEQRSKELLQRNMLKRARNVAFFLGFATIVSIIFFIFALIQKIDADEKAIEAQRNAELAGRQRELALMNSIESSMGQRRANQQAALALLRQAEAEEARTQAEQQRQLARIEQIRAQEQEARAISNAELAEVQRQAALAATERAESARSNAYRLRMLSIAQGMAVKSIQIQDNQLEGLVAQQAYVFNMRHQGERHDRYVYNGVYYALKNLAFAERDTLYSMSAHTGTVRGISFSNDGKKVFSTGTDGQLLMWDFKPEAFKSEVYFQNDARNRMVKTTKDGKWIVVTSDLKGIQCYGLTRGNKGPNTLKGHKGAVHDIVIADNSKYFLSLGDDRTLRINDFLKSTLMRSFNEEFTRMAISPDTKTLVLAGPSGKVLLVEAGDVDQEVVLIPSTGIPVNALAFHPKNNVLAVGFDNGNVSLFQIADDGKSFNKIGDDLPGHNVGVSGLSFSNDGSKLATSSFDRSIQLWDYNNLNTLPLIFDDHNSKIWSITFSPDDKYLLAGTENGNIKVWPTDVEMISGKICDKLERNMTSAEWIRYVAADIEIEETCGQVNLP